MKLETIINDQEYEAALKRLSPIFDANPESLEGRETEQLVNLITEYENIHYPISEIEEKNHTS